MFACSVCSNSDEREASAARKIASPSPDSQPKLRKPQPRRDRMLTPPAAKRVCDRQLQYEAGPRLHRCPRPDALVKDRRLPALDIISAHQADNGRLRPQLLPDQAQLPRMAEMKGIIFTDHADRLHRSSSGKKSCKALVSVWVLLYDRQ